MAFSQVSLRQPLMKAFIYLTLLMGKFVSFRAKVLHTIAFGGSVDTQSWVGIGRYYLD